MILIMLSKTKIPTHHYLITIFTNQVQLIFRVYRIIRTVGTSFSVHFGKLKQVYFLFYPSRCFKSIVSIKINFHLTFCSRFRSDQYNPISSTITIDRGLSIFQYGDTLNIIRIQKIYISLCTINKYQRRTAIYRRDITNTKSSFVTGTASLTVTSIND